MAPKSTVKSGVCLQHYTTIFFLFFFLRNDEIFVFIFIFFCFLQTPLFRARGHTAAQMLVVRVGVTLQSTRPERPVPRGKREKR